ncbi:MAG: hypothetical protein HWD92_11685 [Flavobacteriia bacterium]|nr:hypothetical protein [Flavobacteriia bacterium]
MLARGAEILELLYMLIGGLVVLLVSVFAAFYALNVSRRRIIATEREKAQFALDEQKKLLAASIQGGERERKKIAEELHDHINAQLTVVRMSLSRDKENEIAAEAIQSLDGTIQELRGISRELMPPVLERFGLLDALDDLFDKVERSGGLRIEFDAPESWEPNNTARDLALYRMVQEFIQNSIKYAEASVISVSVKVEGDQLFMELKDDGKGFNMSEVQIGLGTKNIESRADFLNGTAELWSEPGQGVSLKVTVPMNLNHDESGED